MAYYDVPVAKWAILSGP